MLSLAKWTKLLFDAWLQTLVFVWKHVLSFLPFVVSPSDSVLLTFMGFVTLNIVLCSRPGSKQPTKPRYRISLSIALFLILCIFFIGFTVAILDELTSSFISKPYSHSIGTYISEHLFDVLPSNYFYSIIVLFLYESVAFLLVPTVGSLLVIKYATARHLSIEMLSARLWRIIVGFLMLLIVNYLSLRIGHES